MSSPDLLGQLDYSKALRENLVEQLAYSEALRQQLVIQQEMLRTQVALITAQYEKICSRMDHIVCEQAKRCAPAGGSLGEDACGTGRFPVRWAGSLAVVTLPAEIDVTTQRQTDEQLGALLGARPGILVADMSGTRFCDCSGVRALLQASCWARMLEIPFLVEGACKPVMRLMHVLGADRLLEVYPSLEAALAEQAGQDEPGLRRR